MGLAVTSTMSSPPPNSQNVQSKIFSKISPLFNRIHEDAAIAIRNFCVVYNRPVHLTRLLETQQLVKPRWSQGRVHSTHRSCGIQYNDAMGMCEKGGLRWRANWVRISRSLSNGGDN